MQTGFIWLGIDSSNGIWLIYVTNVEFPAHMNNNHLLKDRSMGVACCMYTIIKAHFAYCFLAWFSGRPISDEKQVEAIQ
jgi:hypothetical protein